MSALICVRIVIHSILTGYSALFFPIGGTIKIILWPAFPKSTTAFITIPAAPIQNILTNLQPKINPPGWETGQA
jgi:hypothetical protein